MGLVIERNANSHGGFRVKDRGKKELEFRVRELSTGWFAA
jgi:hypothetical protein